MKFGNELVFNAAMPFPEATTASYAMTEREFNALYKETAGPLLSYLLAVAGRRDIADDLLQETFCRFLSQERPVMDMQECRRYLFRIASNLLRDRWRRREPVAGEESEAGQGSYSPDVEGALAVRFVLQQMKPRERELLWLAYVEGWNHQEIAQATGLRPLSIRMLLFRARKRAAAMLEGDAC